MMAVAVPSSVTTTSSRASRRAAAHARAADYHFKAVAASLARETLATGFSAALSEAPIGDDIRARVSVHWNAAVDSGSPASIFALSAAIDALPVGRGWRAKLHNLLESFAVSTGNIAR